MKGIVSPVPLEGRTFRLFVSSTFSDLKAERDALHFEVFPRLRERCLRRGCHLQVVDLRWGVSEEARLDQMTMSICMEEIDRCRRTSPSLFFLVLLGNRYGWRPLPDQIPAHHFEAIYKNVGTQEQALLDWWYPRDDNAIPPEQCLRPRTGEFRDAATWMPIERRLSVAFRQAAQRLALPDEERLPYEASATEQEIARGALDIPDAQEHVFCFLRDIPDLPEGHTAQDFFDLDEAGLPDGEAQDRLRLLKDRLRNHLPGNVLEYEAKWEDGGVSTDHLKQLCQDVHDRLAAVLDREFARCDALDPVAREAHVHKSFLKGLSSLFVGREQPRRRIVEYATHGERYPLMVFGRSGSGKSTLLARAAEDIRDQFPAAVILTRSAGVTPDSCAPGPLLRSLCAEARREYKLTSCHVQDSPDGVVDNFHGCLELATPERPFVLFLDGLDQLVRPGEPAILSWLPRQLPPYTRIVVSANQGKSCFTELQKGLPNSHMLEIPPMRREEGEALLGALLSGASRTLTPAQTKGILDHFTRCPWPMYMWLAFEEARRWDCSFEPTLAADIPGMIDRLLKRLSCEANHGETLVSRALGYLATARAGLAEDELLSVLSADPAVLEDFRRRSPKSPPVGRLPDIVWSRLRFDLGSLLSERDVGYEILLTFNCQELCEEVLRLYCAGATGDDRRGALASFFSAQDLCHGPDGPLNLRKVTEEPWQWAGARQWDRLASLLANPTFFAAQFSTAPNDTFTLWRKVEANSPHTALAAYQPVLTDPRRHPELLAPLCGYFRITGHVQEALLLAEAELEGARTAGVPSRLRDARAVLSLLLSTAGRPDEALALCQERTDTARKYGDLDDLFVSLGDQGEILSRRGRLDDALALVGEQREIAARLGDPVSVFAACHNEALIQVRLWRVAEAESLAVECERVARGMANSRHLVMALGLQATLKAARGDWPAAFRLNTEAFELCRTMNWPVNQKPVPEIFHDRVKLLRRFRLYGDALLLLIEMEKESEALGFREGVRSALSQRALIAKDMGAYPEALDLHRRAEELCREMNLPVQLAKDLINQAILLLERLGEPVTALQKATEARTIFETTGEEQELANVRKLLKAIGQRLLT